MMQSINCENLCVISMNNKYCHGGLCIRNGVLGLVVLIADCIEPPTNRRWKVLLQMYPGISQWISFCRWAAGDCYGSVASWPRWPAQLTNCECSYRRHSTITTLSFSILLLDTLMGRSRGLPCTQFRVQESRWAQPYSLIVRFFSATCGFFCPDTVYVPLLFSFIISYQGSIGRLRSQVSNLFVKTAVPPGGWSSEQTLNGKREERVLRESYLNWQHVACVRRHSSL